MNLNVLCDYPDGCDRIATVHVPQPIHWHDRAYCEEHPPVEEPGECPRCGEPLADGVDCTSNKCASFLTWAMQHQDTE